MLKNISDVLTWLLIKVTSVRTSPIFRIVFANGYTVLGMLRIGGCGGGEVIIGYLNTNERSVE